MLEPGCGRGAFLIEASPRYRVLGVELDPSTARVAEALADERHHVAQADFADLQLHPGTVSAAIGNVPFGRYSLYDAEHNPRRRLSIHDHFILKAVAALAPGGVAVLVTSRYTLDKLDATARQAIGRHADFLGAARLPTTAHEVEAGTSVVTDVLVLRARAPGEAPTHAVGWTDGPAEIMSWGGERLDGSLRLSRYFVEHPDQILGQISAGHGFHGVELLVTATGIDLEAGLDDALGRVATEAVGAAPPAVQIGSPAEAIRPKVAAAGPIGRIERTETGVFRRLTPAGWESHSAGGQAEELATLVTLRDLAEDLVSLEARPGIPDQLVESTRGELRTTWQRYVARWGPVNRVKINEETRRRSYPRLGGFRRDPGWPRVAALEVYDEAAGSSGPASILDRRLVVPTDPPQDLDDPGDALAVSLQQLGRVDLAYIASLLGTSEAAAIELLDDRVYLDPDGERWVTAEEYLAGDVRLKLRQAEAAAADDPTSTRNVEALREVQPRDVTADELEGTLGAPWIADRLIQEFARSLYPGASEDSTKISVAHSASDGAWLVKASFDIRQRMKADHEFGLERYDALRLLESALNGRSPVVTLPTVDGVTPVDPEATAQAVELAGDLRDRFDAWLLREDPGRSEEALRVFNERFNSYRPRSYAQAATAIAPEGMRTDFELRPHQRQAIARMVYGGNTLLAHPVGAGKTAEMIVGAMELRRLGTIKRPCFVVPNHMLEQFASDIVDLYPATQVLVIDKDQLNKKGRTEFAARVQSHDWDAVVITHSTFTRWPVSPQAEERVIEAKVRALDADLSKLAERKAKGGAAVHTLTKEIEERKANYEAHLEQARAEREGLRDEHAFYFDQSGVDYVLVDEGHEFKNAEITSSASRLRGVPVGAASLRAADLDAKLHWLRTTRGGNPYLTLATATPISNTAAELWVMARYLRPDLLDRLGLEAFDSFRLGFCDTVSAMELDASGTRFRRIERLARYKNLPELGRMWAEFVDVVTIDELGLPRPSLVGGERQVVVVERSPELARFMTDEVPDRADAIRDLRVQPDEDNFLKLCSDARLASFDWETFSGERIDPAYSTLAAAADRIAEIYHRNKDHPYVTERGQPHPRPGAFQLVFSDLGTPKPGRLDTAYERLRRLLVARGVSEAQVGFIHEHDKSDEAKARFFAACREGRIAVALSSTSKMGIGTNVQDRLVALHHLDCPWRPSDIEQREGRILRQGNQNDTVEIYAYATAQSFAVHGWQTVERKAGFVGQIMRADPNGPRVLEPDDQEALAYGQIKAIATGDPDFLTLATLEDQVARLERLRRSHHQEAAALRRRENSLVDAIARTKHDIGRLRPVADRLTAVQRQGDKGFVVRIAGEVYDNRGDAARALAERLDQRYPFPAVAYLPATGLTVDWRPAGKAGGSFRVGAIGAVAWLDDIEHSTLVGALTRIANQVDLVPSRVADLETRDLPDLTSQLERTRAKSQAHFTRTDELHQAQADLKALRETLETRYADPTPAPTPRTQPPSPTDPPRGPSTPPPPTDGVRARLDAIDESSDTIAIVRF